MPKSAFEITCILIDGGIIGGIENGRTPRTMPLSDTACRNAKGRDKPYKLTEGQGLYLLVNPNGSRLWRLKYRVGGKEKLLALGRYPDVGITEAREAAARAKSGLTRRGEAAKPADAPSFSQVTKEWLANMDSGWTPGHAARVRSRLEADMLPEIGDLPIDQIDAPVLLAALRKVEKRGAIVMAKRIRQSVGQIFRYGIACGYVRRDPAADLRGALKASPRVQHQTKLPAKEIPDFLRRLRAYDGDRRTALGLELLLHTWVRTSELRFATWDEIDGDLWRIPKERMKMSRDHLVPLTGRTLEILAELRKIGHGSRYLAPGINGPMSANTLIFAIYRMGYHSRATVHGLRGTASTICNESGLFHRDCIERQLAHAPDDEVRAAYNAAEYLKDRRNMLEWWSDYLVAAENREAPE